MVALNFKLRRADKESHIMNTDKHYLLTAICCVFTLLAQSAQAQVTYIHTDILGSPVAESDTSGNIIKKLHYKPFGESLEPKQNTVGYTGHMEDKELGLTYMQARYYDPVIGRFYSNDPVGFVESQPSSFGRYTYANNNPYKYVDPDGRWGVPGAIYGAIAGATGGFVASGSGFKSTVIGTLAGAAAGAAVGAVAPQTSHMVGLAVAGAVASAGGQAVGSAASAAVEKGVANVTAADINVDPVTTALGGVGAGVGGVVGKGVSQMTMRPIVGQTLDKAGTPTVAGMVAGSVTEGAVIGGAEKLASKVSETLNKVDEQLNK
jgi:RHS repeat-associated protein